MTEVEKQIEMDIRRKELVNIIRILKKGLEEIASNDSPQIVSTSFIAIETLQLMEDTCRSSKLTDLQNLPDKLRG